MLKFTPPHVNNKFASRNNFRNELNLTPCCSLSAAYASPPLDGWLPPPTITRKRDSIVVGVVLTRGGRGAFSNDTTGQARPHMSLGGLGGSIR